VRVGINNNLGFSEEDRTENIRRIAEVSKLFLNCGIITINCFVSPTNRIRNQAKEIIGETNFVEVFVNTPLEICEQRDVKGLYKKARAGEIKDFTGIDAPFEEPTNPQIDVKTADLTVEETASQILEYILPLITKA
jgi:adenylylsulfate kinase